MTTETCFDNLRGHWEGEIQDRDTRWVDGRVRFVEFFGSNENNLAVKFGVPGKYRYQVFPTITFAPPCDLMIVFKEPYAPMYGAKFFFNGRVLRGEYLAPTRDGMMPFKSLTKS